MKPTRPTQWFCILTALATALGLAACIPSDSGADVSVGGPLLEGDSNYLPLAVGSRWELRSTAKDFRDRPIVLEVVERERAGYRIRFTNPWNTVDWVLDPRGVRHYLAAVRIEGKDIDMPDDTLYFDMGAQQGRSWKNAIGTLRVEKRNLTVRTPFGTYENCVRFRETSREGNDMIWTFAPGFGFVQFGEGKFAFTLASRPGTIGQPPLAPTPPPPRKPTAPSGPLRIGLSNLPDATVFSTPPWKMNAQEAKAVTDNLDRNARAATRIGATGAYVSWKWEELEPKKGQFAFQDFEDNIKRAAAAQQTMELLGIRVPDTNNRPMPKDLSRAKFDDPKVEQRLLELIDALAPKMRACGLRRAVIGNEIDSYFASHRKEVQPFIQLFRAGRARLKQRVPGIQVGTTIQFGGLSDSKTRKLLAPLLREGDFLSVTYYPLRADFRMRPPETVPNDLRRIRALADELGFGSVVLQEVGYPSSPLNGSSQEAQARFYQLVLEELRQRPGDFEFVNFFLMADFPKWLVDEFGKYYKAEGSERFKAYIETLGLHDGQGQPKPAWKALETGISGLR